jgi:hypothetical protein
VSRPLSSDKIRAQKKDAELHLQPQAAKPQKKSAADAPFGATGTRLLFFSQESFDSGSRLRLASRDVIATSHLYFDELVFNSYGSPRKNVCHKEYPELGCQSILTLATGFLFNGKSQNTWVKVSIRLIDH